MRLFEGNAEPKQHCCSVWWAISAKEIFDNKCKKFLLRVIRHDRYLDLGNGSKKFENHCLSSKDFWLGWGKWHCLERICKHWGAIVPQVSALKKTLISRQTRGQFSTLDSTQIFEETFHQFASLHSQVCFFILAYQSGASKHKNWKELDSLKLYLKVIKKS